MTDHQRRYRYGSGSQLGNTPSVTRVPGAAFRGAMGGLPALALGGRILA